MMYGRYWFIAVWIRSSEHLLLDFSYQRWPRQAQAAICMTYYKTMCQLLHIDDYTTHSAIIARVYVGCEIVARYK